MTNERQIVSIESITIDPEFQNVLSEKTSEQYMEFKEIIKTEGIRDALVVGIIENENKEALLDGHHRIKCGNELGYKEVPITKMHFPNRDEAKMWILLNQIMRRNLNDFQRIEAALKFKDYFAAKAKENQRAAGGAVPETFQEAVDTYKELAKIAGTSDTSVRKVDKILRLASKKEIDALRRGDVRVSIHSVWQTCTGKKSPTDKPTPKPRAKSTTKTPPTPQSTEWQEADWLEAEQVEQPQTLGDQTNDIFSALSNAIKEDFASVEERINFLDKLIEWASKARDELTPL